MISSDFLPLSLTKDTTISEVVSKYDMWWLWCHHGSGSQYVYLEKYKIKNINNSILKKLTRYRNWKKHAWIFKRCKHLYMYMCVRVSTCICVYVYTWTASWKPPSARMQHICCEIGIGHGICWPKPRNKIQSIHVFNDIVWLSAASKKTLQGTDASKTVGMPH